MDRGALLTGAGVGALLTFALDPDRGARRRALARDKLIWAARKTRDGIDATARDIANRTEGVAAASRARLRGEQVDDVRLVERVRSRLGRACSHPRAIDVEARDGEVTLRGPILAHEVNDLLAVTAAVRGVKAVVSELESYESANGIPSLQGDGHVAGPNIDILQRRWAPATRALVGVAALAATGVCVASYARRSRNVA
jgi:osmotically-inducible protein OsmY